MRHDLQYWVGLSQVPGMSAINFKKLYNNFNCIEDIWRADFNQYKKSGITSRLAENIIRYRKDAKLAEEMEKIERAKVKIITIFDNDYPKLLKEIYNPPPILYYKGEIAIINSGLTVAGVGTRRCSNYGIKVANEIFSELSKHNIVSISGLAIGIDTVVHSTTLENNGQTVAVLGSGIDEISIYPKENIKLLNSIVKNNGLILSEYGIGVGPQKYHFPARDRIIAGLSVATIVIEAPEKSGALITAKYALEFNRDVMAVPHDVYSKNGIGNNNLIKAGAIPINNAMEVLEFIQK